MCGPSENRINVLQPPCTGGYANVQEFACARVLMSVFPVFTSRHVQDDIALYSRKRVRNRLTRSTRIGTRTRTHGGSDKYSIF